MILFLIKKIFIHLSYVVTDLDFQVTNSFATDYLRTLAHSTSRQHFLFRSSEGKHGEGQLKFCKPYLSTLIGPLFKPCNSSEIFCD